MEETNELKAIEKHDKERERMRRAILKATLQGKAIVKAERVSFTLKPLQEPQDAAKAIE